ncbi:MAG: ImmA/IrrE family metallo-endopeptidase [Gammaproteobacteria bacterium]|nr:ImmA/IrrE family metallo-endopeptidase [Gammaproteobacteria bacterium]
MPPPLPIQASVEERVDDVARRIRRLLGISIQEQKGWKDSYAALNGWRQAVQQCGVLVFQARGVDVSEMRGFSVTEEPMPLIVLNTKDAPYGRVFTLLHEFCHVLLRKGGICDLKDRGRKPEDNLIEVFCNRVAAETLVPRHAFAQSPVVRDHPARTEWQVGEIAALAREFSHEAAQASQTGFASPVTSAVSGLGRSFVKLVLLSYYQDRITSRDVSEYLGVRLKHMARIEERVMGSTVMFR